LTFSVAAIAVPVFALTWWLGCYLIARDPARPALRRSAAALVGYALAVACWTVAPLVPDLPVDTLARVLLCVPALAWAGAVVGLLPDDLPEHRLIDRGWLITSGLLLAMVPALPPAGRLVALAPLIGALVLLWRFRDAVHPRVLPVPLTVAAGLYGVGLAVALIPVDLGAPVLAVAAMGLDLTVLGFLMALSDAVLAGEQLRPDLRRSCAAAVTATVLVGGPATLTVLAAPDVLIVAVLQFLLVAAVLAGVGLAGPLRRGLDRVAFANDERLRLDRAALMLAAEALPRRRSREALIALGEEEFVRATRRALDHVADLTRLLRSPLVALPVVDERLAARAALAEYPMARAYVLQSVLRESVDRLRPPGVYGTGEEWRHYNALHVGCILGLQPYQKRRPMVGLDRDARRAMEWFRRYVPPGHLRQWQDEGARLVAAELWGELARADPGWRRRVQVR
jgi:hypothetical protein